VALSVASHTIEHMIELAQGRYASPAASLPELAEVDRWIAALQADTRGLDDTQRIDLLRALERLTCAAAGTQAVLTAELDDSMRAKAAAAGVPADRQGRGIAAQVALARRSSRARPPASTATTDGWSTRRSPEISTCWKPWASAS
jgi:hypothetical protein